MVGGEPSGLLKVELLPSVTCVEGVGGQKKEGRNGGGKGEWRSHDFDRIGEEGRRDLRLKKIRRIGFAFS